MSHDAVVQFLASRSSTPSKLLRAPGPDHEELLALLRLAVRVPDHGALAPWRFLLVEGAARSVLGGLLRARKQVLDPAADAAVLAKEAARFDHAPVIVVVIARLAPGHKIPEREQLLSGGAVCFQLLLAARAHGWGAQWLTGWAAYDAEIARQLGLGANESISGFIHVGTPAAAPAERPRPDPAVLLSVWQPPA